MAWLTDNWFMALQTLAIIASFAFTCITLRLDDRARRGTAMMQLTAQHRELWTKVFDHPELHRVLAPAPDLAAKPITDAEARFVTLLILHLNGAHQAVQKGILDEPEGLRADVRDLFSKPIPQTVWIRLRPLQDRAFVAYVENALHGKG